MKNRLVVAWISDGEGWVRFSHGNTGLLEVKGLFVS